MIRSSTSARVSPLPFCALASSFLPISNSPDIECHSSLHHMSFASALILVVAIWCIYVGWPWYRNWKQAKALHVPIVISPISTSGAALQSLRYILDRDILPTWITRLAFVRLIQRNSRFQEKFAVHAEYGKLFILVTPATCELYVADVDAAKQVLSRWRDFPKPSSLLGMIFPERNAG